MYKCLMAVVFVFLLSGPLPAQEEKSTYPYPIDEIPPGMEVIDMTKSYKLIVPKGAKTRKVGAQIIVESTREYVSRMVDDINSRLKVIEEAVSKLKNDSVVVSDFVQKQKKDEEYSRKIEGRLEELEAEIYSLKGIIYQLKAVESVPENTDSSLQETRK